MIEVFLDTSYAISLAVASDQLHPRALVLAQQLRNDKTRLIVTRAVMLLPYNPRTRQTVN